MKHKHTKRSAKKSNREMLASQPGRLRVTHAELTLLGAYWAKH